MKLPEGIKPVTRDLIHNQMRLASEVRIIRASECGQFPWARERWFHRKSEAQESGRLLLAHSVNAAGRIIRGWYINEFDQRKDSDYKISGGCPLEAAWLATITPCQPSEPAWLYLRPPSAQAP
jgi:hypothetical protein